MYSGCLREAKAKPSRAAGSILCSAKTVAASDPQTGQAREVIERSEKSGSVPPPGGPGASEAPSRRRVIHPRRPSRRRVIQGRQAPVLEVGNFSIGSPTHVNGCRRPPDLILPSGLP